MSEPLAPFMKIAPPLSVPMRHFALAAAAFLVFAPGLCFGAGSLVDFGFRARFALGLVHVLTLGWIAQTILGAWTQMVPVHGEAPLGFPRVLKAAWWVLAAGWAGFVAALWSGSDRYWIPAAFVYAGMIVELAVLAETHRRAKRRDWTWMHFSAAFGWLAALGLAGVLMAFDRQRGLLFRDPEGGLIAHVHMALLGFATVTIFGAGYRLFPWVVVYQLRSRWEGRASFFLLNLGTAGLALDALFFGRRLMPLWACLLAGAYLLYFSQCRTILTKGPSFTPSLAFVLLAIAGGGLWAALGVGLAFGWIQDAPAARAAYVYAALIGFITPVIMAQMHKIAPFLVWLRSPDRDSQTIDDFTSRELAWGEFFALLAAVPLGAVGFLRESEGLVRAAGGFLAVCAACYALNAARLRARSRTPGPRREGSR